MIDTHSHLFVEEFDEDLPAVIERARDSGVSKVFMPNIDDTTVEAMLNVCTAYKGYCFPMIGFHPTSVGADSLLTTAYEQNLAFRQVIHSRAEFERGFEIAKRIEGQPRQTSIHAAGVVMSDQDLTDHIPLNSDFVQKECFHVRFKR